MDSVALFIILQSIDTISTLYGIRIGLRESNPILNYICFYIGYDLGVVLIKILLGVFLIRYMEVENLLHQLWWVNLLFIIVCISNISQIGYRLWMK